MNCDELASRLERGLDDDALEHVESCDACRRLLRDHASEESALRAALAPVSPSEMPAGFERRILERLPRRRAVRMGRLVAPLAVAAAAGVVAVLFVAQPAPPKRALGLSLSFDAGPRQLSFSDGSRLVLGEGCDAELSPAPGTRGLLRLRAGDVFCQAASGEHPLLVEAPGLRARTNEAQFIATSPIPEVAPMNRIAASTTALLYLLSGSVAVEDGPKPVSLTADFPLIGRALHRVQSEEWPSYAELLRFARPERSWPQLAIAPAPTPAAPAPEGPTTVVQGRVEGAPDGRPLAGVVVELSREDQVLVSASTDAEGSFTFMGVVPGTGQVTARAQGFLAEVFEVTVAETSPETIPPIRLREERQIRGRVVDRFGDPVPDARVNVERAPVEVAAAEDVLIGHVAEVKSVVALRTRLTLMERRLSVARVARLAVNAKAYQEIRVEYAPCEATGIQVDFLPQLVDTAVQLKLGWCGRDTLVVQDGSPDSGSKTDAAGRFEVTGLEDGDYVVRAERAEWIDVSGPATARAGEEIVVIVLAHGGEIRGTVYGPDGKPVSGARVNDAVTDAEGRYRIAGLPAGSVDLYAGPGKTEQILFMGRNEVGDGSGMTELRLEHQERGMMWLAARGRGVEFRCSDSVEAASLGLAVRRGIRIGEGDVLEGIDFSIPAPRVIEGTVVDDLGLPVQCASIHFRPNEAISHFDAERSARSDESGSFTLADVFEVAGRLEATSDDHLPVEPIAIDSSGAVTGVRWVLPRASSVRGTAGVAGTLAFRPLAGSQVEPIDCDVAPESEESHAFTIRGLAPGSYLVTFTPPEGEPLDLGEVTLRAGETAELGEIAPAPR